MQLTSMGAIELSITHANAATLVKRPRQAPKTVGAFLGKTVSRRGRHSTMA